MPVTQPINMKNDHGVIFTLGFICNGDRASIVLPLVLDTPGTSDNNTLCTDAVLSMVPFFGNFLAQMSQECALIFIQAEGMTDGKVPARIDYAASDNPGLITSTAMSSQVAGLLYFYEDGNDSVPGHRMREAKTFIPGIAQVDVNGDTLTDARVTGMNGLAAELQSGIVSVGFTSSKYYRVLAAPRPRTPGTTVNRTFACGTRERVATQRRRMFPV